jgi:5-formyltetrahydrofolate cyclo-ligase
MNKEQARREARLRLRTMEGEELSAAAAAVEAHLLTLDPVASARTILIYAALPGEIPTEAIARTLRDRGARVLYPRCVDAGGMTLHEVAEEEALKRSGRYGIPEPGEECPLVSAEMVDAALVPGLAWSRTGTRLGRGAGYYDRLLGSPTWRGFRCGIFLARQEIPDLPRDPWDIQLDAMVTEDGVVLP